MLAKPLNTQQLALLPHERITFQKLRKLLTCQNYFVWHQFDELVPKQSAAPFVLEDFDFEFKIASFYETLESGHYSQIQVQAYGRIEEALLRFLQKKYQVGIITEKKLADKIKQTQRYLETNQYDVIIGGVWQYQNDVIAMPTLYFPQLHKISNLKVSTSTKRNDLIKNYFDVSVLRKLGFEIKAVTLLILDTKAYASYEIAFYETNKINTTTTARTTKTSDNLAIIRMFKAGHGYNAKHQLHETKTLIEIINDRFLKVGKKVLSLLDLDQYLTQIRAAKNSQFELKALGHDLTDWGQNPHFEAIVDEFLPQYSGYSRSIVKKNEIVEQQTLAQISPTKATLKMILAQQIIISDRAIVENYLKRLQTGRIVWYDFEAFSLPFPTIKDFLPFGQATFQVSIITTENEIEETTENLVFDPITFDAADFITIIEQIYAAQADWYVVYNAGYENTRLKEMVANLTKNNHPQAAKCATKIAWIIAHTIDLAKLFIASQNQLPIIAIPALKGKYSIKLLEKYITQQKLPFANLITPYQNLAVQNGLMAMELAINRALKIIGDEEWAAKTVLLQRYCENDVRAMIMVYELIKYLVEKY